MVRRFEKIVACRRRDGTCLLCPRDRTYSCHFSLLISHPATSCWGKTYNWQNGRRPFWRLFCRLLHSDRAARNFARPDHEHFFLPDFRRKCRKSTTTRSFHHCGSRCGGYIYLYNTRPYAEPTACLAAYCRHSLLFLCSRSLHAEPHMRHPNKKRSAHNATHDSARADMTEKRSALSG